MKWHLQCSQHTNQIGFAITTAYVDGRELEGTEMAGAFACSDCGTDVPQVHFEVTVLFWTAMLVAHAEEQQ